jgi:hypothetical protein
MMAANDFNINPPWFRMYQPEPEQNLNDHRDHPGVKNMPAQFIYLSLKVLSVL